MTLEPASAPVVAQIRSGPVISAYPGPFGMKVIQGNSCPKNLFSMRLSNAYAIGLMWDIKTCVDDKTEHDDRSGCHGLRDCSGRCTNCSMEDH